MSIVGLLRRKILPCDLLRLACRNNIQKSVVEVVIDQKDAMFIGNLQYVLLVEIVVS